MDNQAAARVAAQLQMKGGAKPVTALGPCRLPQSATKDRAQMEPQKICSTERLMLRQGDMKGSEFQVRYEHLELGAVTSGRRALQ